ncbi:hypothetical protein ABW19_dt0206313 [Dactylella cylindrospora]|nr:hypothetical protein ABW19_dt0206313 [Dactylella cylindrospora]
MSSTTQEDYFGSAVDPPRRRHKHHKHSRPHYYDSEYESEPDTRDFVPEEREHRKSGRRHRHREPVEPVYEPEPSETDTDGASTDDGKRRRRKHRHHRRERIPDDASTVPEADSGTDVDDSDTNVSSRSGGRMRDRAKSFGETALAALGLDEAAKRTRSRSHGRGRKTSLGSDEGYDSNSDIPRSRSRSASKMTGNTAQAAIIAAVVEAFRARKEPGGITGSRGLKRVVEAAVASGVVEKFLDRKGEDDGKSNRRIAESVLAGLAAQRGINGKRSKRRGRDDEPANALRDLAASGLIAAAGKKFLDYQRTRSQSRGRYDSPERPGLERRRSKSVGEALAALGLGGLAAERFGKSRRDSKGRRPKITDDSSSDSSLSDSDLSLDEEEEQERHKRLRRKEIISIALAILATLHLGQSGFEAREKRARRKELLESGRITEEESEKLKRKAMRKDAIAVGLAILAAAEVVSAFRGMQKDRKEYHRFEEKKPEIEEHRRRKMIQQSRDHTRTPSPAHGEASKYYSQPGYMGPPPGARDVPTYNYYPNSGPIPTNYGGTREAYMSTRDGREIPVVYPSSVTHG